MSGNEYLKYFYKNSGFKNGHFRKLANAYLLQAEVIVPLNQTTGKVILLKVMGFSPVGIIDICSSICALDEMKDLFGTINGQHGKGTSNKDWYELQPKFLFHDSKYNPLTGEIGTFGPSYIDNITISDVKSKWKTFGCSAPTGNNVKFFVRFYVDPSNRAAAEKLLGFQLPDDFCKTKFVNSSSDASPGETVKTPTNIKVDTTGLSEREKKIIAKQFKPNNIPKGGYQKVSQSAIKAISLKTTTPFGINSPDKVLDLVAVNIPPGYPMIAESWVNNTMGIARYGLKDGDKVTKIYVHKSVAERLKNALTDVVNHYGAENMDLIPSACCFTCSWRPNSQSGAHERGLAIDLNAKLNRPFRGSTAGENPRSDTTFDDPIYAPFLKIMKAHGWENLGQRSREKKGNKNDYGDWMHFQVFE